MEKCKWGMGKRTSNRGGKLDQGTLCGYTTVKSLCIAMLIKMAKIKKTFYKIKNIRIDQH
jgi:hypothetical protein